MDDYRQILESEFRKRNESNPRYTLGAFSKQLGLTASQLHDILKKRYGLSRARANQVAEHLNLNTEMRDFFCDLVESEHARSGVARRQAKKRIDERKRKTQFCEVSADAFALIAESLHFALLELTYLDNFEANPKWAAQALGVNESDVVTALKRLQRLGLIFVTENSWMATEDFSKVGDEKPRPAIKQFHRENLQKALDALNHQPTELRDFQSLTLAIATKDLPEAKSMLQDFHKTFCKRFSHADQKDAVYSLSTQFFALTREPQ